MYKNTLLIASSLLLLTTSSVHADCPHTSFRGKIMDAYCKAKFPKQNGAVDTAKKCTSHVIETLSSNDFIISQATLMGGCEYSENGKVKKIDVTTPAVTMSSTLPK